ncbi:MAG: M23 family metallopeptidase [Gemmatimonadota bacterium]
MMGLDAPRLRWFWVVAAGLAATLSIFMACDSSVDPAGGPDDLTGGSDGEVRFPLGSWSVIQDFGVWNDNFQGFHLAEDVSVVPGTPVLAVADGVVGGVFVAPQVSGYGGVVMIEHKIGDQFFTTLYGHVSRRRGIQVTPGQEVTSGEVIAFIADDDEDGGPWGPHLHFGIRSGPYVITAEICGDWLYVGYTRACPGVTHEQYRGFWFDPTDFLESKGGRRPRP